MIKSDSKLQKSLQPEKIPITFNSPQGFTLNLFERIECARELKENLSMLQEKGINKLELKKDQTSRMSDNNTNLNIL